MTYLTLDEIKTLQAALASADEEYSVGEDLFPALREKLECMKSEINDQCIWKQTDEDSGNWESACGDAFYFEEESPKKNGMKFCPFCSRTLVEQVYEPEKEDEEDDE